jgi:hypothetical protein
VVAHHIGVAGFVSFWSWKVVLHWCQAVLLEAFWFWLLGFPAVMGWIGAILFVNAEGMRLHLTRFLLILISLY